jgi:RNA polymerase sigma-70 factor (ECF subfamily)
MLTLACRPAADLPNSDSALPRPVTAETVFHQHAPRIYRTACRMLPNEADAEDIRQEVLLQVVRKLDTFRHEADLATWLQRVTVNAVLAYRRRCARRPERQLPDVPEHALSETVRVRLTTGSWQAPERKTRDGELRRQLDRAIAGLPAGYREVFVLAVVEGLPNAAVGSRLGLGLAAVKSRLRRARLMLREALAPHAEELAAA